MATFVKYYHTVAITQEFKTDRPKVTFIFPGKEIVRWANKVGIVVDPNQTYRRVTCTAYFTGAELLAFYPHVMPDAAPTYSATYPKVELVVNGANTLTMFCMISGFEYHPHGEKWVVTITFDERSHDFP